MEKWPYYPLLAAAYLPDLPLMKKAAATQPTRAPTIIIMPGLARSGIICPYFISSASLTWSLLIFNISSKVFAPVSPPAPTLPRYCADAIVGTPAATSASVKSIVAVKIILAFVAFT